MEAKFIVTIVTQTDAGGASAAEVDAMKMGTVRSKESGERAESR